jgi:glucose/arabinose dehydrogenase
VAAPEAVITLPPGFSTEPVVTGLPSPTTIAWAPDGRMFIAQKDGQVRVFQNGVLLPTPFIDLSAEVNDYWDRGLLGIAIHPDFPDTPYVYLLYTYDPPGVTANGSGARVARLLRVSADPNNTNLALSGSEEVLLGANSTFENIGAPGSSGGPPSCNLNGTPVQDCLAADSPSHTIGTVMFGNDGSLFVGNGDGSHFNYTDPRALRAQSLDSLGGKILRIDPLTGEGYPDNPFYDGDPNSNRSKIWSYGLRNPFRFTIHPTTNEPFIGDVGWNTWEEVNTGQGKNFGWPCYEGGNQVSFQQPSYANHIDTEAQCSALYQAVFDGEVEVQAAIYAYSHQGGETSVQVGDFYEGTGYPAEYQGALFLADYNGDWIKYLTFDGVGNPTIHDFATDVSATETGGPVQVVAGPDTDLYYVIFNGANNSEIRRIRYVGFPPVAQAGATPDSGPLPLQVNFSSAGSFDPDGQALLYEWAFGDGTTSTEPNPTHTYTSQANYTAVLTVTDPLGDFDTDSLVIYAGNTRPVATITTPLAGTTYNVDDLFSFEGTGSDAEEGSLSGSSLSWELLLHHNSHVHFDGMPPASGNTGMFIAPDHGDNTALELCLTATDSAGLKDTDCVYLAPNTSIYTFNTIPSGLQLSYEGVSYSTPFTVAAIVNSNQDVIAPNLQGCYRFSSWSDGGARSHTITIGSQPQTLTATYTLEPLTGPWVNQDIGDVGWPGHACNPNNIYTLNASGSDIWGTVDEFHYVFQPLIGNGEIVARVLSVEDTGPWAIAGVMIRENTTPGARHAMTAMTVDHGIAFEYRIGAEGDYSTYYTAGADVTAPYWVKLVRSGHIFSAYQSSNGTNWVLVGSETITMTQNVYAGLSLSAYNDDELNTSKFDNVSFNDANEPPALTSINDQTIVEDTGTGALAFTISDIETAAEALTVSGSSANPELAPNNNIVFGGSGANRTVTISPAGDKYGLAMITLTVNDGLASVSSSFTLTVTSVNDPPLAQTDAATTEEGLPVMLDVLINDSDPESDTLSIASITQPANGAATHDGAAVTYSPNPGYSGVDTLTYTIEDGHDGTDTATITITINANQPPAGQKLFLPLLVKDRK